MEQYFTAAQFFAHLRRQLIGKPHATQGLLGKAALLPRNERLRGGMPTNLARPRRAVQLSWPRNENKAGDKITQRFRALAQVQPVPVSDQRAEERIGLIFDILRPGHP